MPTNSRPSVSRRLFGSALLLAAAGLAVGATRASSAPAPLETEFRAAYPVTPLVSGSFAGVELDKLTLPGLRLVAREDHPIEDGGLVLSYGDGKEVRVVLTLGVAASPSAARRLVDVALHGVQRTLAAATDPLLGDYAFTDGATGSPSGGAGGAAEGDAFVAGAARNVAWIVRCDRDAPGVPSARDVVIAIRAAAVAGVPRNVPLSVTLPAEVPVGAGAAIGVGAPNGLVPRLRAEGAYVAHSKSGPLLRPFGAGPVTVFAQVTDPLGYVVVARATSTAR